MTDFPASGLLVQGMFIVAGVTAAAGALIAALSTRVIRSVCGLAICCLGLAGLYYFLHSPFLALMEILIYIGAVCVTIVFAVMLAEPDEPAARAGRPSAALWGLTALLVSGGTFWAGLRFGLLGPWTAPPTRANDGSVEAIGVALLSTYSLAFELISLVLLVAILGALVVARYGRTKA